MVARLILGLLPLQPCSRFFPSFHTNSVLRLGRIYQHSKGAKREYSRIYSFTNGLTIVLLFNVVGFLHHSTFKERIIRGKAECQYEALQVCFFLGWHDNYRTAEGTHPRFVRYIVKADVLQELQNFNVLFSDRLIKKSVVLQSSQPKIWNTLWLIFVLDMKLVMIRIIIKSQPSLSLSLTSSILGASLSSSGPASSSVGSSVPLMIAALFEKNCFRDYREGYKEWNLLP